MFSKVGYGGNIKSLTQEIEKKNKICPAAKNLRDIKYLSQTENLRCFVIRRGKLPDLL